MDDIYIVLYRLKSGGPWGEQKVFEGDSAQVEAEEYIHNISDPDSVCEYAYIHGPIISPETMAEAEAGIGTF